MNEIE